MDLQALVADRELEIRALRSRVAELEGYRAGYKQLMARNLRSRDQLGSQQQQCKDLRAENDAIISLVRDLDDSLSRSGCANFAKEDHQVSPLCKVFDMSLDMSHDIADDVSTSYYAVRDSPASSSESTPVPRRTSTRVDGIEMQPLVFHEEPSHVSEETSSTSSAQCDQPPNSAGECSSGSPQYAISPLQERLQKEIDEQLRYSEQISAEDQSCQRSSDLIREILQSSPPPNRDILGK